MELTIGLKVLSVAATVLLVCWTCDAVVCTANSVDDCIAQSQIWQLQQDNDSVFCTEGPVRVKRIYDCIAACDFSASGNTNLARVIAGVNSFCSGKYSRCDAIVDRFLNYSNCYTDGLSNVLGGIIQYYNDDNSTELYQYCRLLAWGRNCQLQLAGTCPYLLTLHSEWMKSDYLINAAFYVCGAESSSQLFVYENNIACNDATAAFVESQCAVTCDITNAKTPTDVCQRLQAQVDCIMTATSNCSNIQRQYIVPRLASYWAANELFGCNIKIYGLIIWARAPQCHINTYLSTCFNQTASGFTSLSGIKQLLTMRISLSPLCSLLKTPGVTDAWLVRQCVRAMTSCVIPLAQAYNWPTLSDPVTTYTTTPYGPLLGPFATNAWGLYTVLSNLDLFTCQASGHVLCASTPTLPTTTTTTTTTTTPTTPTTATVRQTARQTTRVTQAARTTPKVSNGIQ